MTTQLKKGDMVLIASDGKPRGEVHSDLRWAARFELVRSAGFERLRTRCAREGEYGIVFSSFRDLGRHMYLVHFSDGIKGLVDAEYIIEVVK